MNCNCRQEIGPVIVRFKYRHRETVGSQHPDNYLEPRIAAFCQVQFFQKLSDSAVPVATADGTVVFQALYADGTVCARMTESFDFIMEYLSIFPPENGIRLCEGRCDIGIEWKNGTFERGEGQAYNIRTICKLEE